MKLVDNGDAFPHASAANRDPAVSTEDVAKQIRRAARKSLIPRSDSSRSMCGKTGALRLLPCMGA